MQHIQYLATWLRINLVYQGYAVSFGNIRRAVRDVLNKKLSSLLTIRYVYPRALGSLHCQSACSRNGLHGAAK